MAYPRRWAWAWLLLGTLAYATLMFSWFSVPAFLGPIRGDFGLSGTQAGLLTGLVPLTYVPVSLFSGSLTDRIGAVRALGAGLVIFGVAHVLRAGADSFGALLLLTACFGVGATAITFGLPRLVSETFAAADAGAPSSVYLLGSYGGTAAAFAFAAPVLGPALGGWRPTFRLTGVAVLAFAACWWLAAWVAPETPENDTGDDLRANLRAVVGNRALWLVVVVGVVYLALTQGLQNWLVPVLEDRSISSSLAATATGAFVASEAAGAVAVPALSDRLERRRGPLVACALLTLVGLVVLALAGGRPALLAALVVGVGIGGLSTFVRVIPAELEGIGPARTGAAVGLIFAVGEAGGFLGPFLIGGFQDATGSYVPGLAVLAVGAAAAALAGSRLPV